MKRLILLLPAAALLSSCANNCCDYGYKTNLNCRIDRILHEYKEDAFEVKMERQVAEMERKGLELFEQPSTNWWDSEIRDPLHEDMAVHRKSLDSLLISALQYSTQIKVFSDLPLIRRTGIKAAKSQFDPTVFLEATFERVHRPVGSDLEVDSGGGRRLKEVENKLEGGIRQKLATGANVELAHMIGQKTSSNDNFNPDPQGQAELTLRITQPLLKGIGYEYNTTGIRIAQIDSCIAQQELIRQTEAHLLEITRSYWNLYQARAIFFQKERLVNRTQAILEDLKGRANLDANSVQILRAKSSFAQRKSDLVRAEVAIKNSQDRLKSLISDPELSIFSDQEIIPTDSPFYTGADIDIIDAAASALKERSEVAQSFHELNSALLRAKVAKNELMPTLNLFLEAKLSGLSGNRTYSTNAWNNEFTKGSPGYSAGLLFEFPLGNNNAQANNARTKIEVRQQVNQVITTIETILLEVKVAVREVRTSLKDVLAKHESMIAAREDLKSMLARRSIDVGSQLETTSYLEFMLESQERLATSEEEFVRALVIHNISLFNLERAQGTLLSYEKIEINKTGDLCFEDACNLPIVTLTKQPLTN